MSEITVHVINRKSQKFLYLKYVDPVTGKPVWKSSGTRKQSEAIKKAGQWQTELNNGLASSNARLSWEAFREDYEQHVALTLADGTLEKVQSMFNVIEDLMKPDTVQRITAKWVSKFQASLIAVGREQSTVASHCRHLKAALNWAKRQGAISTVPHFERLKKAKGQKVMKGRAITGEEFDRMILAVDKLPERQRASLKFLLRGLWLSGLRLGEALSLTWDQWADGIRVDTSSEYVKLLIPAESEKGGKDRTYPVTPDFAEFLLSVPEHQRSGQVFEVVGYRGVTVRLDTASKVISRLGEVANVKVDQKGDKVVWASAHDLRRAFGKRWAFHVKPMVLKELMRHESVITTEKYYADVDADATAQFLAGLGAPLGAPMKKAASANAETA